MKGILPIKIQLFVTVIYWLYCVYRAFIFEFDNPTIAGIVVAFATFGPVYILLLVRKIKNGEE